MTSVGMWPVFKVIPHSLRITSQLPLVSTREGTFLLLALRLPDTMPDPDAVCAASSARHSSAHQRRADRFHRGAARDSRQLTSNPA
eukprot:3683238-Rhodomonas_salina.4